MPLQLSLMTNYLTEELTFRYCQIILQLLVDNLCTLSTFLHNLLLYFTHFDKELQSHFVAAVDYSSEEDFHCIVQEKGELLSYHQHSFNFSSLVANTAELESCYIATEVVSYNFSVSCKLWLSDTFSQSLKFFQSSSVKPVDGTTVGLEPKSSPNSTTGQDSTPPSVLQNFVSVSLFPTTLSPDPVMARITCL